MKKKSLIIIVVIVIVAVLGLMIAIMSKPTDSNKEDNKANNTESSQTEYESLTEEQTETSDKLVDNEIQETTTPVEIDDLTKFVPEGATTEPAEKGGLNVTLENGITYRLTEEGRIAMTAPQMREAKKIDPTYMEHLDGDGFGPGISYDEYKERQANGTLTWEDMANLKGGQMSDEEEARRGADGTLYGDMKQREDGSYYIELDDGTIIESGDKLPTGGYFMCDPE